MNKKKFVKLSLKVVTAVVTGLFVLAVAGCQYWYQDMKGFLEHWTGTIHITDLQWAATPESQNNTSGIATISTNAAVTASISIENPEGYSLDSGIGSSQDILHSIRVSGESEAKVLPLATVTSASTTSMELAIAPFASVPTPESKKLEHTNFIIDFIPTRTENGIGTPSPKTLTLRYNTPPRTPLEVAYSSEEQQLSWLGAEHTDGWKLVQQAAVSELNGYIYWAWPKGITNPTDPDYVAKFQVYVNGTLSSEKTPAEFLYTSDKISKKLENYNVYRVAATSGTAVVVYALDGEGVQSYGASSGKAPHRITLNGGDGIFSGGSNTTTLYKASESYINGGDLETPSYTGHYVSGWLHNGSQVTFPLKLTQDIDLVAQWAVGDSTGSGSAEITPSVKVITVTYDANGGSGTVPSPQSFTEGKGVELVGQGNLTKTGYNFAGWNISKDGTGTNYSSGAVYDGNINITLYARWTREGDYTITYETNGGENSSENPSSYNVDTPTIKLTNPTKTGYSFEGWYGESNFGTKITEIAQGSTGAKTLYAKWKAITYKVQFKTGGSNDVQGTMGEQTLTYDKEVALSANTYTRKGYEFVGWSADAKTYKDEERVKNLLSTQGDVITLTAQWKAITYKVRFKEGHSDVQGTMEEQTLTYDKEVALSANTYTRQGYTFAGWSADAKTYKDEELVKNLLSTQDAVITLTAQWKENEANVDITPPSGDVDGLLNFDATNKTFTAKSGYDSYTWYVNGVKQSVSGASCTVANLNLTLGSYTITVRVKDASTGKIYSEHMEVKLIDNTASK